MDRPSVDGEHIEAVTAHCERFLGPCVRVLHERQSAFIHLDVLQFDPDPEDPINVFVTCGMSSKPMNVPPGVVDAERYRYAELILCLPGSWPMEWSELEQHFWPLQALKSYARLPHKGETWLWAGHTVSNEGSYAPDTDLCAALVCPESLFSPEFDSFEFHGHRINLFEIAFLYAEEQQYCVEHYSEGFMDLVKNSGLAPSDFFVLDKTRRNVCR